MLFFNIVSFLSIANYTKAPSWDPKRHVSDILKLFCFKHVCMNVYWMLLLILMLKRLWKTFKQDQSNIKATFWLRRSIRNVSIIHRKHMKGSDPSPRASHFNSGLCSQSFKYHNSPLVYNIEQDHIKKDNLLGPLSLSVWTTETPDMNIFSRV